MRLEELKKLAESATNTKWTVEPYGEEERSDAVTIKPGYWFSPGHYPKCYTDEDPKIYDKDAAYIAAMNPQTALRMIELLGDAEEYMQDVPCNCNGSTAFNQLPPGHTCRRCEWLKKAQALV